MRTPVPVGTAKFDLNRCNESPCGAKKLIFGLWVKQYRQFAASRHPAGNKDKTCKDKDKDKDQAYKDQDKEKDFT